MREQRVKDIRRVGAATQVNRARRLVLALTGVMLSLVVATPAQGQRYGILHSFANGGDGAGPNAGLIRDSNGNLYGTTVGGGRYEYGTVFTITPSGQEAPLYSVTGGSDGGLQYGGLV